MDFSAEFTFCIFLTYFMNHSMGNFFSKFFKSSTRYNVSCFLFSLCLHLRFLTFKIWKIGSTMRNSEDFTTAMSTYTIHCLDKWINCTLTLNSLVNISIFLMSDYPWDRLPKYLPASLSNYNFIATLQSIRERYKRSQFTVINIALIVYILQTLWSRNKTLHLDTL